MQIDYEKIKGYIWYNGKFVKSKDAKLHVLSHGLHFASVVFEGIRVYNKKPFRLDAHISRLFKSAILVDIKIPIKKSKIKKACMEIISKQNLMNGYIRPLVWRGGQSMAPGIVNANINVAIAGWDWPIYYSKEAKKEGIKLTVSKWKRPPNECAPTQSKTSGLYAICTLAKHEASKKNFDDAVMFDIYGNLCETTSSNIFFIKNNEVFTPKADCFLNGITRQEIIKICKKRKIKLKEIKIKKIDIKKFESCFISGTAAEISPVKLIDNCKFDNNNVILNKIIKDFEIAVNK